MSEVLQCFPPTKAKVRQGFPQELYLLPQFLCDFDELNLYKKVIDKHIILYEAILKL